MAGMEAVGLTRRDPLVPGRALSRFDPDAATKEDQTSAARLQGVSGALLGCKRRAGRLLGNVAFSF